MLYFYYNSIEKILYQTSALISSDTEIENGNYAQKWEGVSAPTHKINAEGGMARVWVLKHRPNGEGVKLLDLPADSVCIAYFDIDKDEMP